MIVSTAHEEPSTEITEVATIFTNNDWFEDAPECDDFDLWMTELLNTWDNFKVCSEMTPRDAFYIKESIPELEQAISELSTYSMHHISRHMLLDTEAPKSIFHQHRFNGQAGYQFRN